MRSAVLTSSDAGARGERADASGGRLCALVKELGELADYRVLPDEAEQLEAVMRQWIADGVDLIVTTGGTGLGPRDVIPEVTRRIITREIPGMAEAMRAEASRHTPFGMISRQVAGAVDHTLIINFPGSPKAIDELWPVVHPVLRHLVDLLHGKTRHEKS